MEPGTRGAGRDPASNQRVGVSKDRGSARRSSGASSLVEVVEDFANDFGVDDEGENFHPCPAPGAIQRIELVDTVDELGPSSAQRTAGCRLVDFTVRPGQSVVLRSAGRTNPVGVDAVETDQVFFRLGDMDEDTGKELEGVDEGLVVEVLRSLGLVDEKLGVRVIAEAGEVHRGSHQVAGELVEALGIAGVDGGPVMNAETRIPPGQEKVDPIPGDEVSVSKKSEDLVPEEELCLVGVDEGDG